MPFEDKSAMSQRLEFVRLASVPGANVSALCQRFGIGRTCGHTLLARYRSEGEMGLEPRSRRPRLSPGKSPPAVEEAVLCVRAANPTWGGRKIARTVSRTHGMTLAPATVTAILRRNGVVLGATGGGARPFIRFEHDAPNDLWQMDFKGHVAMRAGRLHPLTVLDDHSRFAVALAACTNETAETVRGQLVAAFRRYGLPFRMAVDNGAPWGDSGGGRFTALAVWLIEIGVEVSHSRPYHPQTLGKAERFHRTLKADLLQGPPFADRHQAQAAFDGWRDRYNGERPHDALGGDVPLSRYRLSERQYRETVEPFGYADDDLLRKVDQNGRTSLLGRSVKLGKAFAGKTLAFRPTTADGAFDAFFRHQHIETIDINALQP
jgi:transposase InsO family protein